MNGDKSMDKAGFAIVLLGMGGMAEAYGFNKSFAISLVLIVTGALLIFVGDMSNDIKNHKRHSGNNANVLDRLYYLRR